MAAEWRIAVSELRENIQEATVDASVKTGLNVAELMDSYYPNIDGPTNVVTYYAKNIDAREGYSCKVMVPAAPKKTGYVDCQPFEVLRCKSMQVTDYGYCAGFPGSDGNFKKRVKELDLDIVHAHSPFIMGRYALKLGKKRKIPVVATMHTKFREDFDRLYKKWGILRRPIVWFMMKYIMKVFHKADSVWTVNNASRQLLRDYGYNGDIVVVNNGTDLKYPKNPDELIAKVNALHNLEGQKNIFIFVGRIAFYKNLGLTLEALAKLKETTDDFKMLFIGDGFDIDELKKKTTELGLDEQVIWVGRVTDRELLQGYYLRSDLFLFPSTYDTSSLVPIEAAAHKLPVLLIKDSWTAEAVTDNVNGYLAEENPEAFANRIAEIIADPEKMAEIGEEAHRSVYRTWEMVSEEVVEKYHEIIEKYNETHKK